MKSAVPRPQPLGPFPQPFGRYQLRRCLGQGGMGAVYLAHDAVLDVEVAIKVPHEALAQDPAWCDRFLQEARAGARLNRLNNPHLCRVYDLGSQDIS